MPINHLGPAFAQPLQVLSPNGEVTERDWATLLPEHWTPDKLDRDGDGDIGVAVVDTWLPSPVSSVPIDQGLIAPHGVVVEQKVSANYEDNPQVEVVKYLVQSDHDVPLEELRLVLQDVKEGRIDVVNLSFGHTLDLNQLPSAFNQNPEGLTFEAIETDETLREQALGYVQENSPQNYEAIQLVEAIQEAGAIVVLASENSNQPNHINSYSLAETNLILVSDNDPRLSQHYDVTAPAKIQPIPLFDENNHFLGYNFDNDPQADYVVSPEVIDAAAQYDLFFPNRPVESVGTSAATPTWINQELLPRLLETLENRSRQRDETGP